MIKKLFSVIFLFCLCAGIFSGCTQAQSSSSAATVKELYAMDTVITLTLYSDNAQEEITKVNEEIKRLENLFSATIDSSDVSRINKGAGSYVLVSQDTLNVIETALCGGKMSDGALDITVYPIVKAWGFTTGDYKVPKDSEISQLLKNVNYNNITVDKENSSVKIEKNMALDLGAVAKGYTSACIAQLLKDMGETAAIVNLGGNVETVGEKEDKSKWTVAIENPNKKDYLCKLSVNECSVITSGAYQRNFTQDGITYHHIIDPATGYPANSGITSATVVADNSALGDALSTAVYVMGVEKAIKMYQVYRCFDFVILDDSNTLYVSQGLKDNFQLADDTSLTVKYVNE